MSDGFLSQEEIDSLLNGGTSSSDNSSTNDTNDEVLSDVIDRKSVV